MIDWRPSIKSEELIERSRIIKQIRQFFDQRGVIEVDTPAVVRCPAVDLHIDSPTVSFSKSTGDPLYLISSPEYHMKRLLCAGSGSIYQICKAFRVDEVGQFHNPEFTMLEWYRVGFDHWGLMEEIESLLQELLGCGSTDSVAYAELFSNHFKIDDRELTFNQFSQICLEETLAIPDSFTAESYNRDDALNFLWGMVIEKTLGAEVPVFVHSYPASQASLSRLQSDDPERSTRFEVYYKGLELGNGFYELANAQEQRERFEKENQARLARDTPPLPVDQHFLAALEHGLPDCAGVAMGVDRLIMLALNKKRIDQVLSFNWDRR